MLNYSQISVFWCQLISRVKIHLEIIFFYFWPGSESGFIKFLWILIHIIGLTEILPCWYHFFGWTNPLSIFFIVTGDEEARATTGEGSKQGTTETTPANRGEIGPARPSNTYYLNLIFLKNGLNIILSTYFVFYILKSSKHKQRQTKVETKLDSSNNSYLTWNYKNIFF